MPGPKITRDQAPLNNVFSCTLSAETDTQLRDKMQLIRPRADMTLWFQPDGQGVAKSLTRVTETALFNECFSYSIIAEMQVPLEQILPPNRCFVEATPKEDASPITRTLSFQA